jgi:uncharacterized membrane protein YdjX (TVP38/TMEM64 family)
MKKFFRPVLFILLSIILIWFYSQGTHQYLSLSFFQEKWHGIQATYKKQPALVIFIYFSTVFLLASFSIPGSLVLTLFAGSIFGVMLGTLVVSLATTMGAGLAFLMARFLLRDWVAQHFTKFSSLVEKKVALHGPYYLFTLRLFPASPFVIVNLVMGVTRMRFFTFSWITFTGMFPGTLIYVSAGREFAKIESISDVSTFTFVVIIALSFLPLVFMKFRTQS